MSGGNRGSSSVDAHARQPQPCAAAGHLEHRPPSLLGPPPSCSEKRRTKRGAARRNPVSAISRAAMVAILGTVAPGLSVAADLPGNTNWAGVPEADRGVATSPRNARSSVANVRQGLNTADPTGARGFAIDADTEAQRGTFHLVIPLLNVRGRVAPLRIGLNYQARIWFGQFEAKMTALDGDQFNAPGWSLGLPKLLGGILIEADGVRRPARRTSVTGNGLEDVDVSYVTTDGSDIAYRIQLSPNAANPSSARAEVRYPDGSLTVMQGAAGTNSRGGTSVFFTRMYATAMVDPSGNVTTVEYDWPTGRQRRGVLLGRRSRQRDSHPERKRHIQD